METTGRKEFYTDTLFCSSDLDLDPMTLIYELDLHILRIYLHIKNELSMLRFLKSYRQTDTQTDATET